MTDQVATPTDEILDSFPDFVTADTRNSFEGYIVKAENLVEFATTIRDEMGYDYLSSVTGVDYLPEEKMEVVYGSVLEVILRVFNAES